MSSPKGLQYTKDHEWIKDNGGRAQVGITEFAQSELGELVFVDLPAVGKSIKAGEVLCVVESTKAASDVYAPVSGTVVEVNSKLSDNPTLVNSDPYGEGWLVVLEKVEKSSDLMEADAYDQLLSK